jgi:hypothetical protein
MAYQRFEELVRQLCARLEIPGADSVLDRGYIELHGFDIMLNNFDGDPEALYMGFNFGAIPSGRATRVFRLMLEANISVYAQDQAQLGVDADTGTAQLIVRVAMVDDIDGAWLDETITHYLEHGKYWRDTILGTDDAMFEGVCSGDYRWIKA